MIERDEARQRVAHHVRRIRRLLGLTQPQLAAAASVSQRMISDIETGQSVPDMINAANIAEALNTTTEALLRPIEVNSKISGTVY